jgi:hypothetical protein
MRYMFLIYLDDADFAPMTEAQRTSFVPRMLAYDEELIASGHYVESAALHHPTEAMTVRIRGGGMIATDGPFAETKEHLSGYFVVEARDLNDAMRLAARMPLAEIGSIEVRPLKNNLGEP